MEIWKFKVMTFGPVFETGTMAGLMTLFGRHPGVLTNFRILYPESRLYWLQEGYLSARSLGCAEGPAGAWSAPGGRRNACTGMGWALAIPMYG